MSANLNLVLALKIQEFLKPFFFFLFYHVVEGGEW